jgi:hypothetical protein
MSSWGSNNQSSQAPSYKVLENANAAIAVGTGNLFNNVTPNAIRTNMAVGVFGANVDEVAANDKIPQSGWHLVRQGTGPVVSVTITAGGVGYSNTDLLKVSGGGVNAAATLATNSTGGITSVTFTNNGSGFKSVATSTVAVSNSTGGATAGSNAAFTVVLGGRAGRVHYETLVAMKNLTSNSPGTLP